MKNPRKVIKIEIDLRNLARISYNILFGVPKPFTKARGMVYDSIRNMNYYLFLMRKDWTNFEKWGLLFDASLNDFNFHCKLIIDNCRNWLNSSQIAQLLELSGEIGKQLNGWLKSGIKDDQKL